LELYHKTYGAGEVVVILHGLFGMSDNWKTIARQISDTYSVVLVDLPNHGKSPRLPIFDLHAVVESLYSFLTDNWMYDIRLVGHSLGGKVAMLFAQQYPDMVDRLVSIDIAPKVYKPGHQTIFKALNSLDLKALSSRKEASNLLSKLISDEGTRLFLLKNLKRSGEGFDWKFDLKTLYRDYENILIPVNTSESYDGPTLFVRGGRSHYIDEKNDESFIKKVFPAAEFVTIENAGHWVHADQPEKLEQSLRTFFE